MAEDGVKTKARAVLKGIFHGAELGAGGAVGGFLLAVGLNSIGIPVDPITAAKLLGGLAGGSAVIVQLLEEYVS